MSGLTSIVPNCGNGYSGNDCESDELSKVIIKAGWTGALLPRGTCQPREMTPKGLPGPVVP